MFFASMMLQMWCIGTRQRLVNSVDNSTHSGVPGATSCQACHVAETVAQAATR